METHFLRILPIRFIKAAFFHKADHLTPDSFNHILTLLFHIYFRFQIFF